MTPESLLKYLIVLLSAEKLDTAICQELLNKELNVKVSTLSI